MKSYFSLSNSCRFLLMAALLVSVTSCKTLNRKISYPELVASASPEAKAVMQKPEYENCEMRGNKKFEDVVLKCNLWGKAKLKGGDPKLCTFKQGDYWGWSWELPNNARGVIGYPALEVGRGPWGNKKKEKEAGFPVPVDDIKKLTVDYDFEMYVKHKKYNLAFDLWLTNEEFGNQKNITTEIMIWEDYFDFSSYGKVKDVIETPFGTYKVHVGWLENKKFEQNWNYIAFVRTETRVEGSVDIKYLLDYLVANNHIDKNHYFTSVELGNEIGNSSGLALVKKFEYDFETK